MDQRRNDKRHRRNMAGGETADDGVAGPAQRGDAEQQIGLVGDPVARGRRGACEVWSEADMLVENGPVQRAAAPARHLVPGRLFARPLHRHGFAPRFNGVARIATMRRQETSTASIV